MGLGRAGSFLTLSKPQLSQPMLQMSLPASAPTKLMLCLPFEFSFASSPYYNSAKPLPPKGGMQGTQRLLFQKVGKAYQKNEKLKNSFGGFIKQADKNKNRNFSNFVENVQQEKKLQLIKNILFSHVMYPCRV